MKTKFGKVFFNIKFMVKVKESWHFKLVEYMYMYAYQM